MKINQNKEILFRNGHAIKILYFLMRWEEILKITKMRQLVGQRKCSLECLRGWSISQLSNAEIGSNFLW